MPQYRVEISPNNRAGCKDSVCNKEKIKITKGEIRFGTWVEIQEHGSWAWKHWGCVSGSQLQNLRDECDKGDGEWDFDTIDGYDELTQVDTPHFPYPDVQEKVRRCVKQAHIDAEDFKGDPEKNRPGEKGIHLTAKQKAAKAAAAESEGEKSEDAKPKKAAKRGRKRADEEEHDDEPKTKKSKAAKPATTAKNAKAAKVDKPAPAKPAPVTKSRGRKAVVKEESDEEEDAEETEEERETEEEEGTEEDEETEEEKPAPKKSNTKPKVSAKTAPTKTTAKGKWPSAAKAAMDQESADEKPTPRTRGRRAGRSAKA
ncbi:hypothetical protein E4U43_000979 [Claviceps pusilla]|uniref:PARP-type domain-containing protein n=1 Tax=Claviceps pusilla TaxID=123648 RepID=A0A9P7SWB1_9HYPO|nr:hypothetical protein E4U43_000979 [Claviceps pusilla]